LLTGLLFDDAGHRMDPTQRQRHADRGSRGTAILCRHGWLGL
jgi:hypothetical protein